MNQQLTLIKQGEIVDRDAAEIGDLYREARSSIVNSVNFLIDAGRKLTAKKESLGHGNWIPWLMENEGALGFGKRAAQVLIKAASNAQLTAHLTEADAINLSRAIWGNKSSQLIQQSLSNEHYTPAKYIEAARLVLGEIDLDPASCKKANKIVKAKEFFDEKKDGLTKEWGGRIWMNPPYGDLVGKFVEKLMSEIKAGNVDAAVVLVNAHCTDTIWFQPLWDGCLCFTNHRINFTGDDERSGSTHGSVFIYFGPDESAFVKTFTQFGPVVARIEE